MEKGKSCAAKEVPYNSRLLVGLAQCVLGRPELHTQGDTAMTIVPSYSRISV